MADRIGRIVAPGSRIRADDQNSLVQDLVRRQQVTGGPGLKATMGPHGLHVALASVSHNWLFPARIAAVIKSDPNAPADTPGFPAEIWYAVKIIGEGGAQILPVQPSFGRPVKGIDGSFTKIYPAKVGAFCFILRDRGPDGTITPKLVLFQGGSDGETCLFEPCNASAAPAPVADRSNPSGALSAFGTFLRRLTKLGN